MWQALTALIYNALSTLAARLSAAWAAKVDDRMTALTVARISYLDRLDATVSSRASTADVNTRADGAAYTATRASYLDNIANAPARIKSIRHLSATMTGSTDQVNVTLTPAVNRDKSLVLLRTSGLMANIYNGNGTYMYNVDIAAGGASVTVTRSAWDLVSDYVIIHFTVVEFY